MTSVFNSDWSMQLKRIADALERIATRLDAWDDSTPTRTGANHFIRTK